MPTSTRGRANGQRDSGARKSDIDRHEGAGQSCSDEGARILNLARNAQALFDEQPTREERRQLTCVRSNCTWENGEVVATFRCPFDLLAETASIAACALAANQANSAKNEKWLPFLNTYRTMCVSPEPEFRQVLEEIRWLDVAA